MICIHFRQPKNYHLILFVHETLFFKLEVGKTLFVKKKISRRKESEKARLQDS